MGRTKPHSKPAEKPDSAVRSKTDAAKTSSLTGVCSFPMTVKTTNTSCALPPRKNGRTHRSSSRKVAPQPTKTKRKMADVAASTATTHAPDKLEARSIRGAENDVARPGGKVKRAKKRKEAAPTDAFTAVGAGMPVSHFPAPDSMVAACAAEGDGGISPNKKACHRRVILRRVKLGELAKQTIAPRHSHASKLRDELGSRQEKEASAASGDAAVAKPSKPKPRCKLHISKAGKTKSRGGKSTHAGDSGLKLTPEGGPKQAAAVDTFIAAKKYALANGGEGNVFLRHLGFKPIVGVKPKSGRDCADPDNVVGEVRANYASWVKNNTSRASSFYSSHEDLPDHTTGEAALSLSLGQYSKAEATCSKQTSPNAQKSFAKKEECFGTPGSQTSTFKTPDRICLDDSPDRSPTPHKPSRVNSSPGAFFAAASNFIIESLTGTDEHYDATGAGGGGDAEECGDIVAAHCDEDDAADRELEMLGLSEELQNISSTSWPSSSCEPESGRGSRGHTPHVSRLTSSKKHQGGKYSDASDELELIDDEDDDNEDDKVANDVDDGPINNVDDDPINNVDDDPANDIDDRDGISAAGTTDTDVKDDCSNSQGCSADSEDIECEAPRSLKSEEKSCSKEEGDTSIGGERESNMSQKNETTPPDSSSSISGREVAQNVDKIPRSIFGGDNNYNSGVHGGIISSSSSGGASAPGLDDSSLQRLQLEFDSRLERYMTLLCGQETRDSPSARRLRSRLLPPLQPKRIQHFLSETDTAVSSTKASVTAGEMETIGSQIDDMLTEGAEKPLSVKSISSKSADKTLGDDSGDTACCRGNQARRPCWKSLSSSPSKRKDLIPSFPTLVRFSSAFQSTSPVRRHKSAEEGDSSQRRGMQQKDAWSALACPKRKPPVWSVAATSPLKFKANTPAVKQSGSRLSSLQSGCIPCSLEDAATPKRSLHSSINRSPIQPTHESDPTSGVAADLERYKAVMLRCRALLEGTPKLQDQQQLPPHECVSSSWTHSSDTLVGAPYTQWSAEPLSETSCIRSHSAGSNRGTGCKDPPTANLPPTGMKMRKNRTGSHSSLEGIRAVVLFDTPPVSPTPTKTLGADEQGVCPILQDVDHDENDNIQPQYNFDPFGQLPKEDVDVVEYEPTSGQLPKQKSKPMLHATHKAGNENNVYNLHGYRSPTAPMPKEQQRPHKFGLFTNVTQTRRGADNLKTSPMARSASQSSWKTIDTDGTYLNSSPDQLSASPLAKWARAKMRLQAAPVSLERKETKIKPPTIVKKKRKKKRKKKKMPKNETKNSDAAGQKRDHHATNLSAATEVKPSTDNAPERPSSISHTHSNADTHLPEGTNNIIAIPGANVHDDGSSEPEMAPTSSEETKNGEIKKPGGPPALLSPDELCAKDSQALADIKDEPVKALPSTCNKVASGFSHSSSICKAIGTFANPRTARSRRKLSPPLPKSRAFAAESEQRSKAKGLPLSPSSPTVSLNTVPGVIEDKSTSDVKGHSPLSLATLEGHELTLAQCRLDFASFRGSHPTLRRDTQNAQSNRLSVMRKVCPLAIAMLIQYLVQYNYS